MYSLFPKRNIQHTTYNLQPKAGFSLIELLVAISIIGVLTALGVANFIGVRERARDAQRKANLNEIKVALEYYKIDVGNYPQAGVGNGLFSCGNSLVNPTVPTTIYMKKVPCDPINSSPLIYVYTPGSAPAATYRLSICLENELDTSIDATPTGPENTFCTASNKAFVIVNP